MPIELQQLVTDVAASIKRVDAQAANARTGTLYQPGIGPHTETAAEGREGHGRETCTLVHNYPRVRRSTPRST